MIYKSCKKKIHIGVSTNGTMTVRDPENRVYVF